MTSRYRCAVLFDVDGTLVDSTYLHAISWWQAFRQSSITLPTAELHRAVGMGGKELITHFLGPDPGEDIEARLISAHAAIFSTHWPALQPFRGAKELLERCTSAGAGVVLASSAPDDELTVLRRVLDADAVIAAATSSTDADKGKPAPDILQAALDSVGVQAEQAVFVGDAVWDAKAAATLGLPMVGVCSGGTSKAELRAAGAVEVFRDVQDLLNHFDHSALGRLHA